MNAKQRRRQLKKARREEKEIKLDLKGDIAKFMVDFWIAQFGDLESACRELLFDTGGYGYAKMKRKDLIKEFEAATEVLNTEDKWANIGWYGPVHRYSRERVQHYEPAKKAKFVAELRQEAVELHERLMAEIIGITYEKPAYEQEGKKPDPDMEHYES